MDLKLFDKVDHKSKCIVFGYIREIEQLLSTGSTYFHIPTSIKCISVLYFHRFEKWDPEYKDHNYEITNDYTITQREGGWGSAFLTEIVCEGVHHWTFKLSQYREPGNICIGVLKTNMTKPVNTHLGLEPNTVYAFLANYAELNEHSSRDQWGENYGAKCKKDDIIEMFLDLNELTLSFAVNEKHYGKAFGIDNCSYRAAINMNKKGSQLLLLSYERFESFSQSESKPN